MSTQQKPRIAIEAGLMSRAEAAEYLGLGLQAFNLIAKELTGVRLGSAKYYSKNQLMGYLAKKLNDPTFAKLKHETPEMV